MIQETPKPWVRLNPLTNTYDTGDGTKVAAELCDNASTIADILFISGIRDKQRKIMAAEIGRAML